VGPRWELGSLAIAGDAMAMIRTTRTERH
jgi:hypothetical protein